MHNNKYFLFTCDVEYVGPNTEKGIYNIIELLKSYDVQGTFFVTYHMLSTHYHLVRELINCGHEIASHGFSHPYTDERNYRFLYDLSRDEIEKEVALSFQSFYDYGFRVKGFRAPAFKINRYALGCIRKWFYYDSSSVDFLIRIKRWTGIYDKIYSDEDFTYIPITSVGRVKIPFGSPYLLAQGGRVERLIYKTLAKCETVVFYCHCYDMIPIDGEFMSAKRLIEKLIYLNYCGSKKSNLFFRSLFCAIKELKFQFITCSELCDIQGRDLDFRKVNRKKG